MENEKAQKKLSDSAAKPLENLSVWEGGDPESQKSSHIKMCRISWFFTPEEQNRREDAGDQGPLMIFLGYNCRQVMGGGR